MAHFRGIEEKIIKYAENLKRNGLYVYHKAIESQESKFSDLNDFFIEEFCKRQNIRLYSHQKIAIENILAGKNVCISTPTSSGKTLVYHLPILKSFSEDRDSRFLLLYPLKALAQDQREKLMKNAEKVTPFFRCEIYDGDTSSHKREKIRKALPNCLITNPDMLHFGILPSHYKWEEFFTNLKYIVFDEVHTYRGVFGSHISWIIRRLKRILNYYDANPLFITTSATMGNPIEFHKNLFGFDFEIIQESGAGSPVKHFFFVNPEDAGSAYRIAGKLFSNFVQAGIRTIVFTKARKITELIYNNFKKSYPKLCDKVSSYRSGYLPEERREIERKLFSGELIGVIATSALELGIDIGNLDVCILVGYPGSIINTFQRAGRVGRGNAPAGIFMVMQQDALDQYYAKNPEDFFNRTCEDIIVDPLNPYIAKRHLVCSAYEMPIRFEEIDDYKSILLENIKEGTIFQSQDGRLYFTKERNPHLKINIRESGESYSLIDIKTKKIIGTISAPRVFSECHPGAIYLHRGESFFVKSLDVNKKEVLVDEDRGNYFTRPYVSKDTEILNIDRERVEDNFVLLYGKLKVTERVTGYEKKDILNQNLIGREDLDLPPYTYETMGFILKIPKRTMRKIEEQKLHLMGSLHATEHAMIGLMPTIVLCDRFDLGGICYPFHPQTGSSTIFVYDGYEGGAGLALSGFNKFNELLENTLLLLERCECEFGCPSCIHSPKCGSQNYPLDKEGSKFLLKSLLGHIVFVEQEKITETFIKEALPEKEEIIPDRGIVFFDLETKFLANEVGGWQNAHLMGVSVAVLYDYDDGRFSFYEEKDVDELIEKLLKANLVVGYNIEDFDLKVLSAYYGKKIRIKTFDILKKIKEKLGIRKSLQHLANINLNSEKMSDGIQAVKWFRDGELEKLKLYCQKDVELVRELFDLYRKQGYLSCEIDKKIVRVYF
ncbi:MAG: DEAD/DEAH box helicase [Proteobacteria bacterium]|nr:DEAD/DEAH box helicase [Pseudomonadota bacterium]